MCGRYALLSTAKALEKRFNAKMEIKEYTKRYNAAPSQQLPVILNTKKDRIVSARWGFVPSWTMDTAQSHSLINARAEGIDKKPAFTSAMRNRRCLVLASGFYEWKKTGDTKQPFFCMLKSKEPFAFAGLWSSWRRGSKEVRTFTIVTCPPNNLMKKIHNRMPVILQQKDEDKWLSEDTKNALKLLKTFPATGMQAYEVSTLVNSPKNEDAKVIAPLK